MQDLKSKTIIITGGSLGIGLAVAKKCVQEGARVIIAARNKSDLSGALVELRKLSPIDHQSYSLDVSNLEEVKVFAEWCETNLDGINGLVNCAGIYGPIGKTTNIDYKI